MMRQDTANTLRRAAVPVTTFVCEGCGAVQHAMTADLPKGWTIENSGYIVTARCAPCGWNAPAAKGAPQ